jgi:hypothetical protein
VPRVRLSQFRFLTDTVPIPVEVDPQDLGRALGPPVEYPTKESAPLFSASEWAPGATRGKAGIVATHAVVLDFDAVDPLDFERVVAPALAPYASLTYSTWSHVFAAARGLACLRVVVPLCRPVSPDAWPEVWRRAVWHLAGGLGDPSSEDRSRAYYAPARPPGADPRVLWWAPRSGALLDPLALPEVPRDARAPTLSELGELRARLSRRRGKSRDLAPRVEALARGLPFAAEGERDEELWLLCCELARAFPHAGELRLAEVFSRSLFAMEAAAPGAPTPAKALDKVRRALAIEDARRREAGDEELDRRLALLREAGRDRAYDEAELALLAAVAGADDAARMSRRWVLQRGRGFYGLRMRDGRPEYHGPLDSSELPLWAEVHLAAAESAGVQTWEEVRGERAPKAAARLAAHYGSVVERVVFDLGADSARYDGRTLVHAPCPRRPVAPARSEVAEQWLAELAGPGTRAHQKLLDWVAVVGDQSAPCAALYLHGDPGIGKGLLAHGLARIWTEDGPADLEDVMGAWNEAQLRCPLWFADERAPRDPRGAVRTEEIRSLIASERRPLRRRWNDVAEVRGAGRVVFAANNAALLQVGDVTPEDVEAIAERLFYVRVRPEAGAYLRSLPEGRPRELVLRDELAAHALWLAQTRRVERRARFLVEGERGQLVRWMTVGSGLRAAICAWVSSWLQKPENCAGAGARVEGSRIVLNAPGLAQAWEAYPTNWRPPTVVQVAAALNGICLDGAQVGATASDGIGRPRVLDPEQLRAWCDLSGTDFDALVARVNKIGSRA